MRSVNRAFLPLFIAATACSDRPLPTESAAALRVPPSAIFGVAVKPIARGRYATMERDAEFLAYTDSSPGFGGFFFDSAGALTVHVKGTQNDGVVVAFLTRFLKRNAGRFRDRQGRAYAPSVRVQRGSFDWEELARYRYILHKAVASFDEVLSDDIDELTNRVRIGVTTEAVRARVLARAAALGVPPAALIVQAGARSWLDQTLRDTFRPTLYGGIAIDTATSLNGHCTIGYNVWRSVEPWQWDFTGYPTPDQSQRYFITASHCTRHRGTGGAGAGDGTLFYQPDNTVQPTSTGYEVIDKNLSEAVVFGDAVCPDLLVCGFSDAALIQVTSGNFASYFALTTWSGGTSGPGSLVFDRPYEIWSMKRDGFYVGEALFKIGRATGWTDGQLTVGCVNVRQDPRYNWYLFCQDGGTYYSDRGDSGAPVMGADSWGFVSAYGVHWGKQRFGWNGPIYAMYSKWWQIEQDLGYYFFPTSWY